MKIPWQQLDPETLHNVLEAVVLREGTDYGDEELSFATKVEQLKQNLKAGKAVLVYSELTESVDVVAPEQVTGTEPDAE
ncbi:hypothetical protein CWI84_07815 [Idiomarina tyrosinivorans]|uniref:Uncharacterized protein n=1 Tax=Idiomarina tyrosinivorans TaxID=1445662 RepID=A0A432ZQT3_9GAMM|nr:YheU family protein [Idiomarina tyrosinivorans]RUO80191.1 hypothetical protein CWI84_07815 [Idiomarina tyrosinivorans]